jgi:hypothetical protein
MTITTYHVTHQLGRSDRDASATIHLINDLAFSSGENRSWDATRALVDSMLGADEQQRLGVQIEAEQSEVFDDD